MITIVGFESNYLNLKLKQFQLIGNEYQEKSSEVVVIVCIRDRNGQGYRVPFSKYDMETIKVFDLDTVFRACHEKSRVISMKQGNNFKIVGRGCMVAS